MTHLQASSTAHTHFTLYSLKSPIKLLFSKHNSGGSRIPCANRTWWRERKKRKQCDVVLLATVWWPHQSATRHSSSPCLVSIIPTHMHRERDRERGRGAVLLILLLPLLQPTHPTWGMYRDDTTLHITHLHKPNLKTLLSCKPWGNAVFVYTESSQRLSQKHFTWALFYWSRDTANNGKPIF